MDDLYKELVIEAAEDQSHVGALSRFDDHLDGRNASCGDEVALWIRWDGDRLQDIGWVGEGCIISRAATSVLASHVIGKTKQEIAAMNIATILDLLHFDSISPGRLKCALLGLETIKKVL